MSAKRYECGNGNASYCYGCYQMQEDSDGEYVKYDDYAALRERVIELEAKNAELERLCESTYVARGADAYNHACELTEQWDADRVEKGLAPIYPAGESRSLCGWVESIRELLDNAEATIAGLRRFAQRVMESWPEGGIDGGDLQDIAVECGLLAPVTVSEWCGEGCRCVEYGVDFPFECFRKTALLLGDGSRGGGA